MAQQLRDLEMVLGCVPPFLAWISTPGAVPWPAGTEPYQKYETATESAGGRWAGRSILDRLPTGCRITNEEMGINRLRFTMRRGIRARRMATAHGRAAIEG